MNRMTRYQGAIIRDHHILLIRQIEHATGRSYWLLPGGRIEPNETEEGCVQREMLEETGLHVQVLYLLLNERNIRGASYQRKKNLCLFCSGWRCKAGFLNPSRICEGIQFHRGRLVLICGIPPVGNEQIVSESNPYPMLQRIQAGLANP